MDKRSARRASRLRFYKTVIALVLLAVAIVALVARIAGSSVEGLMSLLLTGDEQAVAQYLKEEGEWRGILSIMLISIDQVISIVVPGMAVQVASGLIYVWWKAFLACFVGFVSGHMIVFGVVRFFRGQGSRADETAERALPETEAETDDAKDEAAENQRAGATAWFMSKMKDANPFIVVMLSCFVPGVPNGIIPHLAARTRIRFSEFALAIAMSSWLQIACNCIAGHFLIRGDYLYMVLAFCVQIGAIALVAWKRDFILRYVQKLLSK